MKNSKIWILTCVHLLLYITVAAYSSEIGNPITDDVKRISLLKQNIPKDYKITVHYIPKEVSAMCWVKLNVFYLEKSLDDLAKKFGNISSNKDNIGTFILILQEMRYRIGATFALEDAMLEFQCHYREEKWPTGRYFDFLEDFFNTANSSREQADCEPPPCPTTLSTTTTTTSTQYPTAVSVSLSKGANGTTSEESAYLWTLSKNVERGLLSLLLIPIAAILFLLVWKVRSRRHGPPTERSVEDPALFTAAEDGTPPLEDEITEKNRLDVIETV